MDDKFDNDKYYFLVNFNELGNKEKVDHHEIVGDIDDIISIKYKDYLMIIFFLFMI